MSRDVYSNHAVRRAALHFLTGKVVSALITFIILLWLVRLLPVADYGGYVVFIASTELGFAFAALGLPWLAARYLTDFRLHASGHELARYCRKLILWHAFALVLVAVGAVLAMDHYLRWVNLPSQHAAAWCAISLLIFEGLGRFLRESLMAPLLLQGAAQFSLVLRQLVLLLAIAVLAFGEHTQLTWVLVAEAFASVVAWLVAVLALVRHLRHIRSQTGEPNWRPPQPGEQWRMALRMHAANIINLAYSPQVFINLVQRFLGTESTALFGFLRALYDQVARYLPATLLFTVLRPKLIASHLQSGMATMSGLVNLVGKLSLFVLFPLIVLVALGGDALVALLSGGTFTTGGDYLLGLLLALLPFSQRQLIETVAVAAGSAGLCTLASALGLLALPLLLAMLHQGLGLWAPVFSILFGQTVFNAAVLTGLASMGYRADWWGGLKLAASAFIAWLAATWLVSFEPGAVRILLACMLAGLVFLVLAWRLQVFSVEERRRLDGLLGRRLLAR
jgi:O-antigen/teichoic acid export membrane protein